MYHHLKRARTIYNDRDIRSLIRTAMGYVPIEINNLIFRLQYGDGTRIMEEDWDTLILLDACRYDLFADVVELEGRLESRISLGSTSEEFLDQNFGNGSYHDTVYVNSNGYLPKLELDRDGTFHTVVDTLSDWDDDLETVHPKTVADAARDAHERYPNKRVIVHFMQPHIPFITAQGRELQSEIDARSVWTILRSENANVDIDRVWAVYRDNLRSVLKHVEALLNEISGKIVVSSDHGNLIGERQGPLPTKRMYGHPWGVYTPELVKVPWFVVENGERPTITADTPRTCSVPDPETTEKRLAALGYKE